MDSYYDDGGCCIVHPDSVDLILTGGKGPITQTNWSFVVSYSRNGGNTWTRCNLSGANSGWCYALAVAPSATNVIYAGGQASGASAVYRTTDFGATWSPTATAPTDTVLSLVVDPTDAAKVFAATPDGAFVTTNSGETWTNLHGWTESAFINQDNSTNHLKVVCQGSQIEVYANGHHLATVTDDSFAEGYVGVIVDTYEPDVRVAFDNIKVYSLD